MGYVDSIKKTAKEKGKGKVSSKFPRLLIHSLQWVSVGYSSALYFAGKKLGHEVMAENVSGKDFKTVFKGLTKVFKELGIGKLSIKESEEKSASVTLKGSATASGMKPVGKPVCFFEAGLIAGILEARLKKKVVVNEVLCGGLGDNVEEFLIKF